jgi:hypothetical protein
MAPMLVIPAGGQRRTDESGKEIRSLQGMQILLLCIVLDHGQESIIEI